MTNNVEKNTTKTIVYWMVLMFIGIEFFFFLGKQGPILEKDSGVFLEDWSILSSYGYIIYPKMLYIFKNLFGETLFLKIVFIIQALLALFTSIAVAEFFRKKCSLPFVSSVLIYVFSFGPYTYTLPQYVSSHCIITEGISFPLYNIWMILALEFLLEKKWKYYFATLFVTVVMVLTRSQLMLFVITDILLLSVRLCKPLCDMLKRKSKIVLISLMTFVTTLVMIVGLLFLVKCNLYPQLTDAVSGRVLCISEEQDSVLFQGMDIKLYEEVFEITNDLQSNKKYFRTDIKMWEDIVNGTNNNTKMLPDVIRRYYPNEEVGDIKGRIAFPLLREHIGEYLMMTGILFVQSIVVSVFYHPDWAYTFGFIIGTLLFVGAVILWGTAKRIIKKCSISLISLGLTLGVILTICVITNLIFIGLQRYVVYPFGWFYISCYLVIRELYNYFKCK